MNFAYEAYLRYVIIKLAKKGEKKAENENAKFGCDNYFSSFYKKSCLAGKKTKSENSKD